MTGTGTSVSTLSTLESLIALEARWDRLVLAMRRPSPFMLHGWLVEWWRHFGNGGTLAVHVAESNGDLLAALPLFERTRLGLRAVEFIGAQEATLGDLMLADEGDRSIGTRLIENVIGSGADFVHLRGLGPKSRIATTLGSSRLQLVEHGEAPVIDLSEGWEAVYRRKTNSKARNLHARRRRQLAELGKLDVSVARTHEELAPALEDAFRLHALRNRGRPDPTTFGSAQGRRFHRAVMNRLAATGIPRIVTLKLEGRAIAFCYYFALAGCMYLHRAAFDPALARYSPGLINTLDTLEAADAEGLTSVEFLNSDRAKAALADQVDPLYDGFGLPRSPLVGGALSVAKAYVRLRVGLRDSAVARLFYYDIYWRARSALVKPEFEAGRRRAPPERGFRGADEGTRTPDLLHGKVRTPSDCDRQRPTNPHGR
jgi:CelD/BcsL family acetyltransferase involved in cellulose biosynthesis